jgi:hypothetical protein
MRYLNGPLLLALAKVTQALTQTRAKIMQHKKTLKQTTN